jgi:hypothetical protein
LLTSDAPPIRRTTTKTENREQPVSHYSYEATLRSSQRASWKLEDVIGAGSALDFTRPFLPEPLARTEPLDFLDAREKRVLNQIRGHAYLAIFGLVEELILPFVLDQARAELRGDDWRVRALLQFAGEEAKHIQLFKRFREQFERGFGERCDVIGPPEEVARAELAHDPLGVALAILHIEWMTQRHYLDGSRDDGRLDAHFKSLLKHHWMEEAQHARLDTLMVEALAAGRMQQSSRAASTPTSRSSRSSTRACSKRSSWISPPSSARPAAG